MENNNAEHDERQGEKMKPRSRLTKVVKEMAQLGLPRPCEAVLARSRI